MATSVAERPAAVPVTLPPVVIFVPEIVPVAAIVPDVAKEEPLNATQAADITPAVPDVAPPNQYEF